MRIYDASGNFVKAISATELRRAKDYDMTPGTYYAILYNTVTDEANKSKTIQVKLLLENNKVPAPDIAYSNETVTITCAEEGAAIYYTTDGTTPSKDSRLYEQPFEMKHNAVIQAIGIDTISGMANSDVKTFVIDTYKVQKPDIYFANMKVIIKCETDSTAIYYTTDGSEPTAESTLYTEPFEQLTNCTVKAIGLRQGYNDSDVASMEIDAEHPKCNKPEIAVDRVNNVIKLSTLTDNAAIYYTLDGSEPTTESTLYADSIVLEHNCTLQAIAVKSPYENSETAALIVNWIKAEKPSFALSQSGDDYLLTITSSTPGATIYYTIGGDNPTAKSTAYTQPVVLYDNQVVKAIAVANQYNNSDIGIWQEDVITCADVAFSFDGQTLLMSTATKDAKIYYTTDGSNPTAENLEYTEALDIKEIETYKAIAIRDYTNNSKVTTFTIPAFYADGTVTVGTAGELKAISETLGKTNDETLLLQGNMNSADLSYLRSLTSLRHLDLSDATLAGNKLPAKAFQGMNIITVTVPNGIKEAGDSLFADCSQLAAITWNASLKVTDDMLGDAKAKNPNLLFYVGSFQYGPSSWTSNLIANGSASEIVLSDATVGYGNFFCPKEFTAQKISYVHNYELTTSNPDNNMGSGWETLALPFDVQRITHWRNGEAAPFAKLDPYSTGEGIDKADQKPFWLCTLESNGFERAAEIKANTPYIIAMPNNAAYADQYLLNGDITFSSANVTVKSSYELEQGSYSTYTFVPAFTAAKKTSSMMPMTMLLMTRTFTTSSGLRTCDPSYHRPPPPAEAPPYRNQAMPYP